MRARQYAWRARIEQSELVRRRELAVLASLPVGIVVFDAAGRVIETNAAFQRIWGAMPIPTGADDFRLFKAWPTGTGRAGKPFEWRVSRVLATAQPVLEEELEIEAFDGVRRTILSSLLPIRVAEGELAGMVGLQVDVTERARAQRARLILSDATAALIQSLDPGDTLRTLSRIVLTHLADCCAIDEMDEHGELRRLVAETTGARSADEAARLLAYTPSAGGNSLAARALRSGKPILVSDIPGDWPETALHADEHLAAFATIGVSSLMVLPLIARGRPLGVLGIVSTRPDRRYEARDLALAEEISRRAAVALDNARLHRQAEAALRARDETLAEVDTFLNASPVGFVLLDRELRFRRVNAAFARWNEKGQDEILGKSLDEVAVPEFGAQAKPLLQQVLRTGEAILGRLLTGQLPPGSGKWKHHLVSLIPVFDVDGTPRAVGAVLTDVTRLKEVEEALREAAELRERFMGVLAHDLRNPLHAIVLSAGTLLRQGDAPPIWSRTVGRIAHAADRMERMVGNLLDLVRSRVGGGIGITRQPTDLADVVRDVVSELEASHPGRHIEVSVQGDTRAELDADRMAEVVSNLAGNALAYSPAESVVQVEIRSGDGELALAVHNAGAAIPPDAQKTIFMPFKRGAAPGGGGPPAMRGLGLGLFIVGEITRAHGGTVAVCSTAEEGTTFTVRVPRTSATAAVARPA
jgi:PAS domain S-box-containing protein